MHTQVQEEPLPLHLEMDLCLLTPAICTYDILWRMSFLHAFCLAMSLGYVTQLQRRLTWPAPQTLSRRNQAPEKHASGFSS